MPILNTTEANQEINNNPIRLFTLLSEQVN